MWYIYHDTKITLPKGATLIASLMFVRLFYLFSMRSVKLILKEGGFLPRYLRPVPQEVIQQILEISPETLETAGVLQRAKDGNSYICPFCGNGSGDDGTGIAPTKISGAWVYHCFKCDEAFNNFRVFARYFGISIYGWDFVKLCKYTCQLCGATFNYEPNSEKTLKKSELIDSDIEVARAGLNDCPERYLRSLKIETFTYFKCGYNAEWIPIESRIEGKYATPTPRLIIPSGRHYLARLTEPIENFPEKARKFIKPKQHEGDKFPFNFDAISTEEINLAVEGEIDAMSIWQATRGKVPVIALEGAAVPKAFIEIFKKKFAGVRTKPQFLIMFDSDSTGKNKAPKFQQQLIQAGFPAVCDFLYEEETKDDFNDILSREGEDRLAELVEGFIQKAKENLPPIAAQIAETQAAMREGAKALRELTEGTRKDAEPLDRQLVKAIFALPAGDLYNAERLYLFSGNRIKYLSANEHWGIFKDGVWDFGTKSNSALYPYARKLARFMENNRPAYQYKLNERGGLSLDNSKPQPENTEEIYSGGNLVRRWQQVKTWNNAIAALKGVEEIIIRQSDLDRYPMLLNVKNGVIDLETGKLMQAAPELLLTRQCNAVFNPTARADVFNKFIEEILPDEETRSAVLRFLGYCLSGCVNEEKALFVWGRGANGKGTLFKTLLKMLGDYGTSFNINALLKAKNPKDAEAATPEIAKLEGVRVAVANEIPLGAQIDVAKFKDLSGSDPIPIRPLFQPARIIENPTHKFILAGNSLPKTESADDDGLNRRLAIVKFEKQFVGGRADLTLKARLETAESLSGILNILVAECRYWLRDGLIISEAMRAEKKAYLADNDWFSAFVADECEFGDGYFVTRKAFFEHLKKMCPQAQLFQERQLVEMVLKLEGVAYKRSSGKSVGKGAYCFFGIRLFERGDIETPF